MIRKKSRTQFEHVYVGKNTIILKKEQKQILKKS